jgi:hypothetical protein
MLSPQSRPLALQEMYERSRRPPHLEKLDSLNDPPSSCLKVLLFPFFLPLPFLQLSLYFQLYSDPQYFENAWILEMEKQREAAKVKRKERKKKRAETALEKKAAAASAIKIEVLFLCLICSACLFLLFFIFFVCLFVVCLFFLS